jgi:membrane-associated phospholipid phosphatase
MSSQPSFLFPRQLLTPVLLFIIIFTFCGNACAQKTGGSNHPVLITNSPYQDKPSVTNNAVKSNSLFRDFRDDFTYLFREPDFYLFVGGMTLTPIIFKSSFDHEPPEINEAWGPSRGADNFFELGETMGSAFIPVTASVLIMTLGSGHTGNGNLKSFGSDLLRAQFFNGLVTLGSKALVNRTRPSGGPYSYPSGHTSTAFTTAGVIYNHFGPKLGIPAYIGATYVGLSRLQENMHYLSDIVAGAALGTYIAYKITHRKEDSGRFNISPGIVRNSPGVSLSFKFN